MAGCKEIEMNGCGSKEEGSPQVFKCSACLADIHLDCETVEHSDRKALKDNSNTHSMDGSIVKRLCSACREVLPENKPFSTGTVFDCSIPTFLMRQLIPEDVTAFHFSRLYHPGVRSKIIGYDHYVGDVVAAPAWSTSKSKSRKRKQTPLSQSQGAKRQRRYRSKNREKINEKARERYHARRNAAHEEFVQRVEETPIQKDPIDVDHDTFLVPHRKKDGIVLSCNETESKGHYKIQIFRDVYERLRFFHSFEKNVPSDSSEKGHMIKVLPNSEGHRRLYAATSNPGAWSGKDNIKIV